ncbi:MAG: SUMF1/EgtB/PvdO family nonheme iron enzyme [Elusimicrobia bacterium]|nr:SUMF1/EgtB/PvdO family nonheme iron enzyme [Elusimicrobiota bacterium]
MSLIPQDVEELITTPLMLTAACILYHYDKQLPEQRAELYDKFINSLIYKRFDDPIVVLDSLMMLAFETHKKRARNFDKTLAIEILTLTNPKAENESPRQYELRLDEEFNRIEQNCGLLKLENGEYSFWHLTFQEFLAAREIVVHMRMRDYAQAIAGYWDDDWYDEVIELFIGHLSNTSRAEANGLVGDELKKPGNPPFKRWRLAARALLDIQPNMRDKSTIAIAQKCLQETWEKTEDPRILADAGEILGWLGDPRDLEEFVEIEAGAYPVQGRSIDIKAFEMGRYPVTNQWYAKFIQAGGYQKEEYWSQEGKKWLKKNRAEGPGYWHERKWKYPNAPVVGVSWYEADAFCRWLTEIRKDGHTYHLPTEEEWEVAAAGKEGREYAWGKWQENRCNYDGAKIGKTSAVGVFLKGCTPDTSIADLSGNVWEWTDSWYDKDKDWRVLRGGSWLDFRGYARCADRYRFAPESRFNDVGFRGVRT